MIEAIKVKIDGNINFLALGNESRFTTFLERIFFIKRNPEKPILENKKRATSSIGTCFE